jgi:RNA polymerase sigma factor (TIGR02999 family)
MWPSVPHGGIRKQGMQQTPLFCFPTQSNSHIIPALVEPNFSSLITKFEAGDRSSLDDLMPGVYAELRRLAERCMGRERVNHTLQPTALVHEAYMRMVGQRTVDWRNRAQLVAIAVQMMRRVLLDHAEACNANKRGGKLLRVTLTDASSLAPSGSVDLIDLDNALQQLSEVDSQQAAVVELRFFGGMNNDEIAEVLQTSSVTVQRRWASARLWLARCLAEARPQ